jgi:tetratricopeptide (TPR) repeat protein
MPQKDQKTERSLGAGMLRQSRDFFTGREEEKRLFRDALHTLKTTDEATSIRVFNIHGQGGMGKTTLLFAYRDICDEQGISYVYIDAKRESGESIIDLFDLMRSIRSYVSKLCFHKFPHTNPFSEFDKAYKRYRALQEKARQKEEKETSPQSSRGLAKIVAGVVQESSKLLPGGQIISGIAGNERMQEGIGELAGSTASNIKEWYVNAFGNAEDAEFFLRPEHVLTEKLSNALEKIFGNEVFVLLLDTYEELNALDPMIREKFLAHLNIRLVAVLSGRYSLEDRCDVAWRHMIHFIEMKPFSQCEVIDFLRRQSWDNRELSIRIYEFTQGLPLAVGLAFETLKLIGDLSEAIRAFEGESIDLPVSLQEKRMKIIDKAVDIFLSQVPKNQRLYVWSAAVFARFNEECLSAINKESEFDRKSYNQLVHFSFVIELGDGYLVHDLVRNFMLLYLQHRHSTEFYSLHSRAAKYYLDRREKLEAINPNSGGSLEWRALTVEYIYHALQADHQSGQNILFQHLADALNEQEYIYAHQLTEILKRPPQIVELDLRNLRKCCISLENGDDAHACALLETDLAAIDIPPFQQHIAAMTLGNLFIGWPFNEYDKALAHYAIAYTAALKIPATDRASLALAMQGECHGYLQKWELAAEKIQKALNLAKESGDQLAVIKCQIRLGRVFRVQDKLDEAKKLFDVELPQGLKNRTQIKMQILEELGLTLEEQGKYQEAITQFEGSLDLARKLSLHAKLASTWQMLGVAYQLWGKLDTALQCYNEALQVNEKNHNEGFSANVLKNIGLLYERKGEFAKATRYLEQSRDKYLALEHFSAVASLWRSLGDNYLGRGKFDEAIRCYEDAREQYRTLKQPADIAGVLGDLGWAYQARGDYARAIKYLEQGKELFVQLDRPANVANMWRRLGGAYRQWGKFDEALRCYEEAYNRYMKLGQTVELANVLLGFGSTHRLRGDYACSIEYLERSKEIYVQLDRPEGVAFLCWWIATVYTVQGKFDEAIRCYEDTRDRYMTLGRPAEVASILLGLGWAYQLHGDYASAIKYLEQGKEQFVQLDRPANVANMWRQLGIIYRQWGKFDEALRCYEEAYKQYTALDDTEGLAYILADLGLTYQESENYTYGIEYFNLSKELYFRIGRTVGIARIWSLTGELETLRENYQQSLNCFCKALDVAEKYELIWYKAWALSGVGACLEQLGKYREAGQKFIEALDILNKIDAPIQLAKIRIGMGRLLWRAGKRQEARLKIGEAILMLEQRNQIREKALELRVLGKFFLKLGETKPARECLQSAFEIFTLHENEYETQKINEMLRGMD